ncbi:cytochrome P450 [Dendrothele bispora CBS 962.96]|uniref:Cytochrome P450 n=1 Tax=Dendrothele bispora (strain CBS 962.96) TaxID=1314807 RepID=A0A4S8MIL1_DENBC|nr:cytochrome P450 [Dendrothele bispora CBS 962.96]
MDSLTSILQQYSIHLLCVGALVVVWVARNARRLPLPPGPRGLPIVGNIFDLQTSASFLQFTEWKQKYGPIFSLNLLGQTVIVLNTHKVAADLLDRRSNLYSDRPRFVVVFEYLSDSLLFSAAPYGDYWRRVRKLAHENLNNRACAYVQPFQEREAATLALTMVDDPANWDDHLKRSSASAVLSVVYGFPPIKRSDDPIINRIMEHMHRTVDGGTTGQNLVEVFPILRHVPSWMAKWKREAMHWCREDTKLFQELLDYTQKSIDAGDSNPCFSTAWIQNAKNHGLSRREIAWLSGTMFGAGVETTSAALSGFVMAMVMYPDVLRKAQEEMDRVVGKDRLPTFEDKDNLPYCRAMVKETLRWWPPGPVGVPHRLTQDDVYDGYLIPKGSTMIYNVWAMNRDPEVYGPDVDAFRPERFLDESGQNEVTPPDTHQQGHVTYGFGRRACVGLNVANNTIFIDLAYIVWALNIRPAKDADGKPIMPKRTDWQDDGLVVRPKAFKCEITPRHLNVREIVQTYSAQE